MTYRAAIAPFLAALLVSPARAEVPTLRPAELEGQSTHIVTGEVCRVYASVEREGDFEVTHGVAEVKVGEVRKGDGVKPGGLVYARFWSKRWVGVGAAPPDAYGHDGVPAKGERSRVYLRRAEDGGHDVLLPNGFGRP